MNSPSLNYLPALPEIFLLAMACVVLVFDLFSKSAARTSTYLLAQLSLAGCALLTLFSLDGEIAYTFNGMFVDDLMADLLKLMLYLVVSVALVYARAQVATLAMPRGEFYMLALFATLGMMVMISANHFLTLYLGLEILSLSVYAMVALNRESVRASEAAMKYFILGALASGLLLYGMSMIYGATGSLEIPRIGEALSMGYGNATVLIFGLVFIVAGIAFKFGVVPFHMWVPDVYQGAPTATVLFLASAPKLAAFAMIMRLLVGGLIVLAPDWQGMLILLAVLSLAIGNLAAIAQTNIKRMLGYSAISHMGFVLLGVASGVVGGDPRYALNAYSSAMFYVVTYSLTTLAAFGVILLLSRAGFEAERLEDFKGLNQRSPWYAFVMLMVMFSMAGIPFFVGFFAKLSVLQAVVASGEIWLAVVAVLFSLVGAFYYLRVVKLMYFDAPAADAHALGAGVGMRYLLSLNGVAILALGIMPQSLMSLCAAALVRSM